MMGDHRTRKVQGGKEEKAAMSRGKRKPETVPADEDASNNKKKCTNADAKDELKAKEPSFSPELCTAWFYRYTTPESPKVLGPEGMEKFCKDIDVDPSDVVMLVLAWELQAERMGYFTLDEWMDGLSKLECDTVPKLKVKIDSLRSMLDDQNKFRAVFRYAYNFVKEKNQKNLELKTAMDMLKLLLEKRWALFPSFNAFLEKSKYKVINKDQWNNIFEFTRMNLDDLSNYDADAAWPVLMDEFVEWLNENGNVDAA